MNWHDRFSTQAAWTKPLRHFLYTQTGINTNSKVLEVGCGTGVITSEIREFCITPPFGIDLDFQRIVQAQLNDPFSHYSCADACQLPFSANVFDYVLCHYFFLWVKNPLSVCREILRVLKRGGYIIALAEPDYLSRIDTPAELEPLGELQTKALIDQGANPAIGRLLPSIFAQAGVAEIQYGASGFQTSPSQIPDWFESEWITLNEDLHEMIPQPELNRYKEMDLKYRQAGSRVLWIPTFYIYGRKS